MKNEFEVKILFLYKLTKEESNYFTSDLWTDQYILNNNFYTSGFAKENMCQFIIGSEFLDDSNLKNRIIETLVPFLKSLLRPYEVASFGLYLWEYSREDIELPTLLNVFSLINKKNVI